ncbi:MAG TPA: acyltransferase family protein [Roseiarcus sp.]|nr:acyltransferase family protein [Roseiarcus sp.]
MFDHHVPAMGVLRSPRAASGARYASLDGLRGVLAAFVMLAHFQQSAGHPGLLPFAKGCVEAFFVISAYALTVSWNGRFGAFLGKRFLRLWPGYALSLAIASYVSGVAVEWTDYFWYPFKGFNIGCAADPVVWSLYTEVYANLAMPLIILLGRRTWTTALVCISLILLHRYGEDVVYGLFFVVGSYATRFQFDFALLNSRFCQWLGKISFSLYLTHEIVIGVCKFHFPSIWEYVAIPLCLVVATAFWIAVEKPSLWASRQFGKWIGGQPARSSIRASEVRPTLSAA